MKIAAIALASAFAAALGLAQSASAQQNYGEPNSGPQQGFNNDHSNQPGQGPMGNQNSGSMMPNPHPQWNGNWSNGQQAQNQNWSQGQNQNWRQGRNQNSGQGWHPMHRWGMEGHMGPMWHRHAMMNRGTSFAFGNAKARIFVHCNQSESLQDCTNAANDLLDQIASSRSNAGNNSSGSTNGSGSSSSTNGLGGSRSMNGGSFGNATGSGSIKPGSDMQNNAQSPDQNPASAQQDQSDSGE
jgi:hypothetical protein